MTSDFERAKQYFLEGLDCLQGRQLEAAEASFLASLQLLPDRVSTLTNLSAVQLKLKKYVAAEASAKRAIELEADNSEAWLNLGLVQKETGNLDGALRSLTQALAIRPDYAEARWARSLTHLLAGHLPIGWSEYDSRWSLPGAAAYRHPDVPELPDVDAAKGKRVLVWAEQGLGDTLHMARYVDLLSAAGCDVSFEVQPELRRLLAANMACQVLARGEMVEAQFQLPLMSLPRLFHTSLETVPVPWRPLQVPQHARERWHGQLSRARSRMRIAIACSGNPQHDNDRSRSARLELFLPLLEVADLYLVQKELNAGDAQVLARNPGIQFLGKEIGDFVDTAAIIEAMDVVVSVDTSLVHLAGSMGKRTLVLLATDPDWRWMLGREDSPWYPALTLLRQQEPGDWGPVIEAVLRRLRAAKP